MIEKEDRPALVKFLLFLIAIPILIIGYLYVSHLTIKNGEEIGALYQKYRNTELVRNCDQSENKSLLDCYRKDYYAFVRESDPYERVLAFNLMVELYQRDQVLQISDKGKLQSQIDYLEMIYTFFKLTEKTYVDRSNLRMGAHILVRIYRDDVLVKLHETTSIIRSAKKLSRSLKSSKKTKNRLKLLEKNLSKLILKSKLKNK